MGTGIENLHSKVPPPDIVCGVLNRIRQLESRLLRSVTRPSPAGSLRFSMRSSGTSGGTSDSAGMSSSTPLQCKYTWYWDSVLFVTSSR